MDFVSLEQTLEGIAARVKAPEEIAAHPDLVEAWQYSEAAATLHQLFQNLPEQCPRWVTPHDVTGRPIFDDGLAAEGVAILEYLAGWYTRQRKFHADQVAFSSGSGQDLMLELANTAHYRKYKWGTLSRSYHVGFNRADMIRFLVDAHVEFSHRLGDAQADERRSLPSPSPHNHDALDAVAPDGNLGRPPNEAAEAGARIAPRLTLPEKSDTWAKVIAATYETLVQETRAAPSGVEVWLRMNHKPPTNYPVAATKDHGLPAITLPGEKPLTRDGFTKRWRRYTSTT